MAGVSSWKAPPSPTSTEASQRIHTRIRILFGADVGSEKYNTKISGMNGDLRAGKSTADLFYIKYDQGIRIKRA